MTDFFQAMDKDIKRIMTEWRRNRSKPITRRKAAGVWAHSKLKEEQAGLNRAPMIDFYNVFIDNALPVWNGGISYEEFDRRYDAAMYAMIAAKIVKFVPVWEKAEDLI